KVAFITGRASSTEYTVQSATGGTPTATTGTAVNVYRAHLELDDWEDQFVATVNASIHSDVDDLVLVDRDLVTNNYVMMVACYASGAGDNKAVNVSGWTTGADNYIKLYTPVGSDEVGVSQRHRGKWDSGKYNLIVSSVGDGAISLKEEYVNVDGLQIHIINNGYNYNAGISTGNAINSDNAFNISNNIIKGTISGENSSGITNYDSGGVNYKIWNNIIYGFSFGASGGIYDIYSTSVYAYNNTIFDVYYGIRLGSGTYRVVRNNIVQNCTDGFHGTFHASSDYNISDLADDAPGSNSKNLTSVSFVDESNKDFRLSSSDTAAKDAGEDLSGNGDLPVTLDVEGFARSDGGSSWDIGADEYQPAITLSSGDLYRYLRYKALFNTVLLDLSPRLNDISFGYSQYPSSAALTSNAYDSSDPANIIADLAWTQSATTSSRYAKFQLRTAPD
ncbi:MAG: hypothetical protein GY861_24975, partial [bacterium]|nr:hypothetical protein [bacterium]